jgi:Gly-Xaa carboxypeptidase
MLKCISQVPLVPKDLREDIIKSLTCDAALKRVEKATSPLLRPLFGTTQAIDLINGGVKANALPEEATAVVNHRISDDR